MDIQSIISLISGFGYLGAFLSGFLGSSSLFIAIFPSFIVIPLLATQLNPLFVGLLGGIGAGIGQYLHYYIGLGGRRIVSDKIRGRVDSWRSRLDKYGVVLIVLFAATPLTPDDLLWIPLGMMRYPKTKALAAAIFGKIILNLFYAYAGFYGLSFLLNRIGI
ncbi:MAG: VTT domain-containing protein [Nitrososphaerales archaeon]